MTYEEYIQTLNDTIYTNNRIIRENQVLQTRLLTMLENSYLANNPLDSPTMSPIYNTSTSTGRATPGSRYSQPSETRIIQDYILSYIYNPYATTSTNTSTSSNVLNTNLPSTEQIANSTNLLVYDSSNTDFTVHVCPITLTNFANGDNLLRIRQCQHIFKESSLLNWFRRNSVCPLCRYDIRNYVATENEDTQNERHVEVEEGEGEREREEGGEGGEGEGGETLLGNIENINNIYNTLPNPTRETNSQTRRNNTSSSRLRPNVRSFVSQMNIPDNVTNEISNIFQRFLTTNLNGNYDES